jgi:hypothetical protein
MTTSEKIAAIMFDGLGPGTKAYYKAEYYMGQAIAQYGEEAVLKTMLEGEQAERKIRSKSSHD